jgi:hypothetical protein
VVLIESEAVVPTHPISDGGKKAGWNFNGFGAANAAEVSVDET